MQERRVQRSERPPLDVRLAQSAEDVRLAQRLRFEVFEVGSWTTSAKAQLAVGLQTRENTLPESRGSAYSDGTSAAKMPHYLKEGRMNGKMFGALVVSAVVGLAGGAALADHHEGGTAEKGCYRKHCGGSVTGYKGSCGGTKVDALSSEKACTDAGGAWTTETAAEAFKKKMQ